MRVARQASKREAHSVAWEQLCGCSAAVESGSALAGGCAPCQANHSKGAARSASQRPKTKPEPGRTTPHRQWEASGEAHSGGAARRSGKERRERERETETDRERERERERKKRERERDILSA